MTKQKRGSSSKEDSKCDRISMLPDDLLVFILSFLTLKEATTTSILSRRWRYLWTYMPKLDFDGTESLLKMDLDNGDVESELNNERRNYVRRVNDCLMLCKGSTTIEEFRVFFDLDKTHERDIDGWLRYALARKVERLELDLTVDACLYRSADECYDFPNELLRIYKRDVFNSSCGSNDFGHLKKVTMKYVNVNGEAVEELLSRCPFLEDLSVYWSGVLSSVKIVGPFPSFKRLEICSCENLNSIEIRDVSLVYLRYSGGMIPFVLENVPLLVEIFVGGLLTLRLTNIISLLWNYLPLLETFAIDMLCTFSSEEMRTFYTRVKMNNLKKLSVRVYGVRLLWATKLILAFPNLERFTMELIHEQPMLLKSKRKRKHKKMTSHYPHLKEVKIAGYCGRTRDVELVMHFLESAVSLEKIIIDPKEAFSDSRMFGKYDIEYENDARTRARKQLTKLIPPRINLEIL